MGEDNKFSIASYYVEPRKTSTQKIVLIVLCIVMLVALIFVILNCIKTIQGYETYKQYENQLKALEYQDKIKKEQEQKIPKLTDEGKNNINNIYHSETKRVFLTFDDGPSTVTPTILDILKQENIKATFFVLGSRAEVMLETLKRIYKEGHYIANHGYSHQYSSIYSSPQAVLDEFNKCNDIVKNIIGVPEYNSHLFRFPGGLPGGPYAEIKNQAKELLNQNEIVNIDWNALTGDAETNDLSIEFLLQRLKDTTFNKNSIVVLMHDSPTKQITAEALPQVILYLREQGYEFKNFYEIIK